MATYYKYVERNAKDRINWNEVGKSVSDMLNDEAKVRLDKKAEIDENSRQFGIELANAPVGDYDHGNTFINEYTTNMSEYRRMQDNLLKSGQLNLGDYTRNRQNNTDGTTLTFDLATAYQEAYTEKMDRWKSSDYKNKSQYREIYEMESVEGLANMRTTGSFINPTNGVISLATRDKNGGLDMNNTRTAAEMYGSIKRKYDAYDVNAAVKSEVDYLGDYIISDVEEALRSRGLSSVSQLTDQKEAPGYTIWEDDTISSMMADTDHITSILTNNVLQTDKGVKYTFTDNETDFINDKSGTLIYLDKSVDAAGKPVFKPEQETVVKDFLRNRIRQQIDVKLDINTAGYKPQSTPKTPTGGGGLTKNQKKTALTNMAKLAYSLETKDVLEAIDALEALNPGLDIDVQGNELVMTEGGVTRTVNMKEIKTVEAFLTSHGNFILGSERQIDDINDLVAAGGFIPAGSTIRNLNDVNDFNVTGTGVADTLETFEESFRRTEGNKFNIPKITESANTNISEAEEEKAVAEFSSMVSSLPNTDKIVVRDYNIGMGIVVTIPASKGSTEKSYDIDLRNTTTVVAQAKAARDAVIMYSLSREKYLKDEKEKEKYVKLNKFKAKTKEAEAEAEAAEEDKEVEKVKRTVPQIIKEDGVTQAEAIIIFNKQ